VPQAWGRIFGARAVAVLYGARLGVGPLTILRTWLWWAALVVGASAGPWWSAATGAAFGLVRTLAMLVAGTRAGALRAAERKVAFALAATGVAVVAAALALPQAHTAEVAAASPAAGQHAARPAPRPSSATERTVDDTVTADGRWEVLPADVASGWTRVADDPNRHLGRLDLAAAAAAENDAAAERALLETRRFERGQARAWRAEDGRVAYASVYEFDSPDNARAYLGDGLTTIEARGARMYDIPEINGSRGFSQAEHSNSGSTVSHGAVFVRGARFYLVFVSARDSAATADDARAVATAIERFAATAPQGT
jgi:hypothetical protein